MTQKFANNASGILADPLPADAGAPGTTITLQLGTGANFPTIVAPDWCIASIEATDGTWEITKVVAHSTASDTLIVEREWESSLLTAFASGSRVELRMTKGTAENFFQTSGGTFTGTVDFDNNESRNMRITNFGGNQSYGEDLILRSANGVATHQLNFPSSGAKAQMGTSNLVTEAVLVDDKYAQTNVAETISSEWSFSTTTNFNGGLDIKAPSAAVHNAVFIRNSADTAMWRFRYRPDLTGADLDALDIYSDSGGGTVMRLRGNGDILMYGDVTVTGALTVNGAISTTNTSDITADGDVIANGN